MSGRPGPAWTPKLRRKAELLGAGLVAAAIVWWAIVYAQVMLNTGIPAERTLPCLLYTSDRCSLAMALCREWHFLGIRRYWAGLLWLGATVSALAVLMGSRERRGRGGLSA